MAGKVKGITIEFSGDTTKLDKSLREVSKSAKGIDKELRQVDKALKFNPSNVDLWRQKQTLLTQKVDETRKKLDLLKQKQAQMDAAGVDKNSEEYRKLQREIIETESKLKHFEGELRKVGNVKLRALGEQFKQVGAKMTAVGKEMTMKVTAPLVAVGAVAASKFAEVDKTMQLTNATMKNSEAEAALLNKAMKSAAASSTYGMNDAATATLNFARAGLSAQQAASALAPAMALAAGEGGELDTVSAGLVATINGFHGSFEDAAKYADVFANACNNSALDVNSLSEAMSVAAPIFSSAGYSVNDAALYMGVMANNGIEANKAANSLKTGLARLVSPAKDGAEMMDALGINIANSDGTMKDSVQIQKELHDAFAKLSESEQIAAASAIFGKNQMAPWLALINTAPGSVTELNEALAQNGTALEMQASMMSGFGGSLEQLKSGIDVAATSLGEALAPVIQKVAQGLQMLVNWFNSLSPQMQTVIATVGLVVAAIGPLLVIVGTLVTVIGNLMIFGPLIVGAIGAVVAAIGPAIAIVAALIAIGVLLYKNWDKIKAKAKAIWNQIKATIVKVVTGIKTTVTNIFNGIKTKIASIWDGIKTKISNVVTGIKTKVSNVFSSVKDNVSKTWNKIKESITKPIEKAKETVKAAIDKIKGFFSNAKLKLPHIDLPHFKLTGSFSLKKMTVPHLSVSWYKKGGIFDNPSVIGVGEAGPEAVVPLDKLWDHLDRASSAGGITINVYGTAGQSAKDIAEEVKRILIKETKARRLAW